MAIAQVTGPNTVSAPAPVGEACSQCGYTFTFPHEVATHVLAPVSGWLCARCRPLPRWVRRPNRRASLT